MPAFSRVRYIAFNGTALFDAWPACALLIGLQLSRVRCNERPNIGPTANQAAV